MSLNVSGEIVAQAERGRVDPSLFAETVRESLPKAWEIIEGLVERLRSSSNPLESYGTGPMDEETRGQLLRMLAGNALRNCVESHFTVSLAFQNCHNVAVVRPGQEASKPVEEFKSPEAQVKNQKPQFQHC